MGPGFLEPIFSRPDNDDISIETLKNVPENFHTRGFHHTPARKKSETGENLLMFGMTSNLYRDLA